MKNLRTATVAYTNVDVSKGCDGELQVAAYDSTRGQVLFVTASGILCCVPLLIEEAQWTLPLMNELLEDRVVGIEFIIEQEAVVVGFRTGDLQLIFLETRTVEVVGKVEGGIIQLSVSPDGELLAVATGLGHLLLMTQDWDVFYEIFLDQHHKVESLESVQISWRGDGKYFATLGTGLGSSSSNEIRVWERDTGTLHACTKAYLFIGTAMDWIPTGSRIAAACSMSTEQTPPRVMFFERNGLERGSFDVDGPSEALVEAIRWNCNSELLAVLIRCENWDAIQVWCCSNYHWYLKQERRYCKSDQVQFFWGPEKPMQLITWTVSGLVQLVSFCWDSAVTSESVALVIDGSVLLVTPLKLALMPPPMCFFKLKFQSPVQTVAFTETSLDKTFIAASLSDGSLSILTLPRVDLWHELEGVENNVVNAEFDEAELKLCRLRCLIWIDSDSLLGVKDFETCQLSMYSNSLFDKFRLPDVNAMKQGNCTFSDIIMEMKVQCRDSGIVCSSGMASSNWLIKFTRQTLLCQAVALAIIGQNGSALIHLGNGLILPYFANKGMSSLSHRTFRGGAHLSYETSGTRRKLFSSCLWLRAVVVESMEGGLLVALDEQGQLQVESHLVCSDCTSFVLHLTGLKEHSVVHIVYTTKQGMLHVASLEEILGSGMQTVGTIQDISHLSSPVYLEQDGGKKDLDKKVGKRDLLQARPLWERGAKLIAALGGTDVAVILQTARGNLETVYPRDLVLGSIATALFQWNFKDAILLARQHRIDLNIIVDFWGWRKFVQMACEFVKQVNNLNYVTELVCAIKHESVMDTVYKGALCPFLKERDMVPFTSEVLSSIHLEFPNCNKVKGVLEALRGALEKEVDGSPSRELCILTTLTHSDPPELEEALKRIKKLREEEICHLQESMDAGAILLLKEKPSAEDALKHLLWLSDFESVFNAALGLYDLHLAAMVASHSQCDPKEFLPFLQELEEMAPPVMRYTIDCKLQKFESALCNLGNAGNSHFSECLKLMKSKPELFHLGKQIFKESSQRMSILEAWGDHLLSEGSYEDAAAAYCSCSQLQKAMSSYRAGGIWQGVFVIAGMLGLTHEEVSKLAAGLCEELQAMGRPGDAAKIILEYCNDVEGAIRLFIEAREWVEAVRVAVSHCCVNQVKAHIEPAAVECANTHIADLEGGREKIGKYLTRYLTIREHRILLAMKIKMESSKEIDEDLSLEIRSNASNMSAYTSSSTVASKISNTRSTPGSHLHLHGQRKSKSRKIRAGSPGEETALVEHLRSLALTNDTLEEVRKLLHMLVLVGHALVAEKLQHVTMQYQYVQEEAIKQIDEKIAEEAGDNAIKVDKASKSKNLHRHWPWVVLGAPAKVD